MEREDLIICGDLKYIEDRARELILRTLQPMKSEIDLIAVKVINSKIAPANTDGYMCTILVKSSDGETMRFVASDNDEMLAVYDALKKVIEKPLARTFDNSCWCK